MARYSNFPHTLAIVSLTALLVTSFTLVLSHNKTRCEYSTGGDEWQECTTDRKISCNAPAVEIRAAMGLPIARADFDLTCPWSNETSIVSYVSILLAASFMLIYGFSNRIKSSRLPTFLLLTGVAALAFLLASVIMMIVDIVTGHRTMPNDYKTIGFEYTKHQAHFIVNCLLMALAFFSVLIVTVYSYRYGTMGTKTALLDDQPAYQQYYEKP